MNSKWRGKTRLTVVVDEGLCREFKRLLYGRSMTCAVKRFVELYCLVFTEGERENFMKGIRNE